MRNAALTIALLLFVAAQPALADRPLEDPADRMLETRLSNGLVVLTLEDRSTPVVSFQMWVRVGSRDESRYTGLAHLFEHMMFKGSKNIAPEEHARLISARGGRVNAFTSRDYTVYFADVTSETLPLVIELEAERVANLDISEKTLGSEREVVLEERRMRTEDRPNGRAMEALMALTFQAHPYRWPVIGWRSDVEAVTLEECRRFFRRYYAPNNMVISIVGDFDGAEALALIRRTFGSMDPAAEIPRNPTVEPEQRGERRATVAFEVRSPLLVFHGTNDFLPFEHMTNFHDQVEAQGVPARFLRALGEGHGFGRRESQRYAFQLQLDWFRRHLGIADGSSFEAPSVWRLQPTLPVGPTTWEVLR